MKAKTAASTIPLKILPEPLPATNMPATDRSLFARECRQKRDCEFHLCLGGTIASVQTAAGAEPGRDIADIIQLESPGRNLLGSADRAPEIYIAKPGGKYSFDKFTDSANLQPEDFAKMANNFFKKAEKFVSFSAFRFIADLISAKHPASLS